MNRLRFAIASLFAAVSAGCSSAGTAVPVSDGGFPAAPFMTLASASGLLQIAVRSSPQPPPRGIIDAEFMVTRVADGSPVDGLTLQIQPWMPAMNHGAIEPTVIPEGGGRYQVTSLDLFMAGYWELRTTFSGSLDDNVTPAFEVP